MTNKLYIVAGKIAAGKSTLAGELSKNYGAVKIAEDDWLAALFADQMTSVRDYARCAEKLRTAMGPHIVALLQTGISVVLDYPANTVPTRAWMRNIIDTAGVAHELHFLDVPDAVCKARLRARNAAGSHVFAASDAQFDQITKHFAPPRPEEGFTIITHPYQGTD